MKIARFAVLFRGIWQRLEMPTLAMPLAAEGILPIHLGMQHGDATLLAGIVQANTTAEVTEETPLPIRQNEI